jgi:hypothetical protein
MLAEITAKMEEEFEYLTIQQELGELNETIRVFMVENHQKEIFRDNYKLTLVRRTKGTWNADKLKSLVPKNVWLKITRQTIDPEKIDDLVRQGVLEQKVIGKAFEVRPEKPHVRKYEYKEGESKEDAMAEEAALMAAMSGDKTPKKRGRKSSGT